VAALAFVSDGILGLAAALTCYKKLAKLTT
jgi:hypothetical protein